MKKKAIAMLLIVVASLVGCGGVPQTSFDSIMAEAESLKGTLNISESKLSVMESKLSVAESKLAVTESKLSVAESSLKENTLEKEKLQTEYDEYKEKMKPFEDMTAAQAEAEKKKAEAEKKRLEEEEKAKKEAEKEAKRKAAEEAAAAKAAEEAKGYETGITYDQLARTPDNYTGKKVKFKGEVVQIIEGDDEIQIRLAVNSDYDTILYCGYNPSIVSSRVLEDDIITIYGTFVGLMSYQSTLGGKITIPGVYVDRIDQ